MVKISNGSCNGVVIFTGSDADKEESLFEFGGKIKKIILSKKVFSNKRLSSNVKDYEERLPAMIKFTKSWWQRVMNLFDVARKVNEKRTRLPRPLARLENEIITFVGCINEKFRCRDWEKFLQKMQDTLGVSQYPVSHLPPKPSIIAFLRLPTDNENDVKRTGDVEGSVFKLELKNQKIV